MRTRIVPMIAIVDDDPSVRRALGRLIRSAGYAVEAFASAGEFLDAAPVGRTTCLILDLRLEGMTGFELQGRLAADGAHIPIIVITAHDDAATRERAQHAGAAAYLPKPFDPAALLDAIQRVAARA
jgi:FixJ family two-component response regulator